MFQEIDEPVAKIRPVERKTTTIVNILPDVRGTRSHTSPQLAIHFYRKCFTLRLIVPKIPAGYALDDDALEKERYNYHQEVNALELSQNQ